MQRLFGLIACLSVLSGCKDAYKPKYDLVIHDVALFDGETFRSKVDVAIRNDSIILISVERIGAVSNDTLSGAGKYVIPGLVNAHVHLFEPKDLKTAIENGIFAVIDLHKTNEDQAILLRQYRDSSSYASFYSSGFAATVPGGHPTAFGGDIETINESISPSQFVTNRLKKGSDFIKIIRDSGGGPPDFTRMPTLEYEQIREIIRSASAKNKLSIAHTVLLDETIEIARLGISGFAHLWFGNESISTADLRILREKNVFVIPTALTQKKIWEMINSGPPMMKKFAEANASSMDLVKKEIDKLHQGGILLLAGTDPPNFNINQHNDLFEELQIYREAGLSNIDVLKTATSNPSKVFDLNGAGRIEIGKKANFIMLHKNPLDDLTALKLIAGIWKNGDRIK